MGNAARKARKRAGVAFTKPAKRRTGPRRHEPRGIGLVTGAEIMAAILTRPARG